MSLVEILNTPPLHSTIFQIITSGKIPDLAAGRFFVEVSADRVHFPAPLLLEFDAQRGEFPVKEEQVALHFVNRNELAAIVKDADFDEDTQQNIFSNANTSKSFSSMPSVISLNPAR